MTTLPEYQAFALCDDELPLHPHNTKLSDDQGGLGYTIPLYRGILQGQDSANSIDDKCRYIYLGVAYRNCFIMRQDFEDRCTDQTLSDDFAELSKGRDGLFPVWSSQGTRTSLPRNLVVMLKENDTLTSWSIRQKKQWANVMESADNAVPPTPYNVLSRFIQPANFGGLELVFTPSDDEALLSRDDLETQVTALMNGKGGPKYHFRVLTWQQATSDPTLVLLSSNYFGFYHTFITAANYQSVCTSVATTPLARPWPSDLNHALSIDTSLGKSSEDGTGLETTGLIAASKIRAARGMRATLPSQQSVMGDKSATEVAIALWGATALDPKRSPSDAEWLHRSAFHYGGTGQGVNLSSSQKRANLVFGTGEANTDMIRGENALTDLVNACPDSDGGNLVTLNVLTGKVRRRKADASFDETDIPPWVEPQRTKDKKSLWWLCMKLNYVFTFNYDYVNINLNGSVAYDPFSRYIPFRFEAVLDKAILGAYVTQAIEDAGLATRQISSVPAPLIGSTPLITSTVTATGVSTSSSPPSANPPDPTVVSSSSPLPSTSVIPSVAPSTHPQASPLSSIQPTVTDQNPVPSTVSVTGNTSQSTTSMSHMATKHLTMNAAHQWRSVTSSKPAKSPLVVNGAAVRSASVVPHTDEQSTSIVQPQVVPDAGPAASSSPSVTEQKSGIADSVLNTVDPPPAGFTLEGQIDLFGIKGLTAQFFSWNGPLPADVTPPATGPPIYDRAVVSGDFNFSSVLPILKGTPFDSVTLRNVTFMHQNVVLDPTKAIGWHADADFVIQPSCGLLYNILRTVLKVQEPIIHLHTGLGTRQDWGTSLRVPSFTLDGTFPGLQVPICKGLTLTTVGVELIGIRRMERQPKPHTAMDFGFGIFGTLALDVPSSVTPLDLDYRISELSGYVHLSADLKGDIWEDVLGVSGLQLSDVSFDADVSVSAPLQSFDFLVSAVFSYNTTTAVFSGSYAHGGTFSISATVVDFNLASISDIFESITGELLTFPEVDISIGSASLVVTAGSGLAIQLQNVEVEGHVAADAALTIGPTGVTIRGDVTSSGDVSFGDVRLEKAYIEVELVKGTSSSEVILGGEVAFEGLVFDAATHLYKDVNGALQWTIVAALSTGTGSLALSKLAPDLKGSFLDFALTEAVFAAASQDDPQISSAISVPYVLHQGVQICAALAPISALDALMQNSAPTNGLILSAGWSKTAGFSLDIHTPAESVVHLGRGIVSDPFQLRIQTGTTPALLLIAGVKVPVTPSPNILDFQMSLAINPTSASASAQMVGYWTDPLGLGRNVKIGPNVALSIDITFAQFLVSGLPSGFGIIAGLAIGKASASIAMEINENPDRELISGKVQAIDVHDLISFANTITGLSIPQPPNFLRFEDVELYICPGGTTIGTIVYPPGFSFQASVVVFGKRANIACAIGSTAVSIKGSLDDFTLGPLAVRGVNDPKPTLDIELSKSQQHIDIDGMVTFFDSEAAVSVRVDVMPKPAFTFVTTLKFTDLLLFDLEATLVGAETFGSIANANFIFHALLEQHILQYVEDQITDQFNAAEAASRKGFTSAQNELRAAEAVVSKRISDAERDMAVKEKAWLIKRDQITRDAQGKISNYNAQIARLSDSVRAAEASYNAAIRKAQSTLQQATNNRASALAGAQKQVEQAKRDAQLKIASASRNVQNAENKMNHDFGNAERAISNAQSKVDGIQHQIDGVNNQISHLKHLHKLDPRRIAIVGLGIKLGGLEVGMRTADGVLKAAKGFLQSTGYIADKAAIGAAQGALQAAKDAAPHTIAAAQGVLQGVDKSTAAAVSAAQATVKATGTGTEFVALQGTQHALAAYKAANDAVYSDAVRTLNTLTSLAEYAAYESALATLTSAKHATSSLDGLNQALRVAEQAEELTLKMTEWVAAHALSLVDIQKIELAGALRGMMGPTGGVSKPFTVNVQYVLAGKPGSYYGDLDLSRTSAFIAALFGKMWNEAKSALS